jgi:CTP synthase
VIEAPDAATIYEVPLAVPQQRLDDLVLSRLGLDPKPDLSEWRAWSSGSSSPRTGASGSRWSASTSRYVDSYKSVQEALIHGGIANDVGVDIDWLSSEDFEIGEAPSSWPVPRPADPGRLRRARGGRDAGARSGWARENELPFFGICLGLQTAIIEFSRTSAASRGALGEWSRETQDPGDLPDGLAARGHGPGRHHAPRRLHRAPRARLARRRDLRRGEVSERHRHRYEVNNAYREPLVRGGMRISGPRRTATSSR